jgi:hypothetical protein
VSTPAEPDFSTPVRWQFIDPRTGETWTVPLNPREMGSPHTKRSLTYKTTTGGPGTGRVVIFERIREPQPWEFSGAIITKDHYDKLLYWSQKPNVITIKDHYGRNWLVLLEEFAPTPKRSVGKPWRHEYTMRGTVFPPPTGGLRL